MGAAYQAYNGTHEQAAIDFNMKQHFAYVRLRRRGRYQSSRSTCHRCKLLLILYFKFQMPARILFSLSDWLKTVTESSLIGHFIVFLEPLFSNFKQSLLRLWL